MTAVAAQPRRGRGRVGDRRRARELERAPTLFSDVGGEPTLDEFMSGVWEGLAAHGRAACPVCGGEMLARPGAHARPSEGRCRDCGTTFS